MLGEDSMDTAPLVMLVGGSLLLIGLLAVWAGRRTPVPRVSLLLLLGVLIGPSVLDILPAGHDVWFEALSQLALVMIGFLIGGEFTLDRIREQGPSVAIIAFVQASVTVAVVATGLLLVGVAPLFALPLAGIATAAGPASTMATVRESESSGSFPQTLLGVVAFTDLVALVFFSVLIAVSGAMTGADAPRELLAQGAWELVGAVLLGLGLGVPAAYLSGRIQPGEPILEEALGIVLVCAGLGIWLHVSFLLASIVLGMTVTNLAEHHERTFREIEGIEWPFLVLFFILSGASLEVSAVSAIGLAAAAYILLRAGGKIGGAMAGGAAVGLPRRRARWLGLALLPEAGVALGMALLAAERLPDTAHIVLPIVILSTVVFEVTGPILMRLALRRIKGKR
jgi:Kef-type K+ transport system membrane component KefB